MVRPSLAIAALLVCGAPLLAQRGGRADALQNYLHGSQHDSILLLQIRVENGRAYFKPSDLRKMPRSVLIIPDPSTGVSHKYEGVALEYLLRGRGLTFASGTLQVSYGRHQKVTVSDTPIGPNAEPLVADTIDGKSLSDYVPYFLILPTRAQADIKEPLQHVDLISVRMSPH
jgi:hypothetical protein